MKKDRAIIVVGARPNFMKAAPIIRAMKKSDAFEPLLLHTGQHYGKAMSDEFFSDLDLPKPDIYLGVGSDTISKQSAKIMSLCEDYFLKVKPRVVIVVGDVTSTLAAALTAKRLNIPVAHVEAGLRSFDEAMPEEINRKLTDHISDFLFTTEESGNKNLLNEGITPHKIYFVGNTMIDTLLFSKNKISQSNVVGKLGLQPKNYAVLTLHRPSNVDSKNNLKSLLNVLSEIQKDLPIVFPIHPRTRKQIKLMGLEREFKKYRKLILVKPLGYVDFIRLVRDSRYVLTDSGGIQEEATILGIPCVTLRENTERTVTVTAGTNILAGTSRNEVLKAHRNIILGGKNKRSIPKYWDGKAAYRLVAILSKKLK